MNVAGTVEAVGTKPVTTKFGTKNTYSAKVNGQWFKFGFKDPKLAAGETVSMEYTAGTYGNEVTTFTKGVAAAPTATPTAAPKPAPVYTGGGKGVFPIPALDGQRSIVRQNALTNARELVATAFGNKAFTADEALADIIIHIAKRFEAYTAGDMDMEMAKASLEGEGAAKH